MNASEKNDQLKFALDILNHPELLREGYVREWLNHEENKKLYEECRVYLEAGLRLEIGDSLDVEGEYERFADKMRRPVRVLFRRLSVAAAIVILVVSITWLMTNFRGPREEMIEMAKNQPTIVPGKNQAVLITGSGQQIVLGANSGEKIMVEKDVQVIDDSLNGLSYDVPEGRTEVHYHVLQVPKGGEFKVVLCDGTTVWLNSESELRFPTGFADDVRKVELKGEGYFSVTHDDKKTFVVVASGIETRVYGTEFNVRSYPGAEVDVTLVEGKVSVKQEAEEREFALVPGQNACFANGGVPEITKVNVHKYIAWKEGYFYYENERLETIMNDLKRWYDFDVVYVGDAVKNLKFELWSSRDSSIGAIVNLLVKTNKVSVKMEGATLIVSGRSM